MRKGVDISNARGQVDWAKAKATGVEFAVLRCGFGSDITNQDDMQFEANVSGCEANDIPWGAYLYSYATNLDEAESEVQHILRLLSGKKPMYPIYIDMEDADGYKAKRDVSNNMCVDICDHVCSRLEESGYYAGIYANKDWLENRINDSKLNRFDKWLAQWNDQPTYGGQFGMWQYTSDGSVDGISGRVDMNQATGYRDYPTYIKENGLNGWATKPTSIASFPVQTSDTVYTVVSGDTLCGIAAKYNINYQHLVKYNGIADPNKINVGQIIRIPGIITNSVSTKSTSASTYIVNSGDSLWRIAENLLGDGAKYPEIMAENGLSRDTIYPGQVLTIPQ